MTDFNNIARAQGQAQQGQQFYDAQRYEAMRGQGNALERGAQGFVESRQRGQQIDLQQQSLMLEEQRANAAMTQFQQELQMRQRDADMRVEEHQLQMALLGEKLQLAQAIDATDLGRAQVEQSQAAAKLATLEAKRREKELADLDRNQEREFQAQHYRSRFPGGPRDLFEAGYVPDPESPMGYRLPKDGAELQAFGARIDQSRERPLAGGSATTDFNAQRNYIAQMHRMAEAAFDEEGMEYWRRRGESLGGALGQPPPSRAASPQQAAPPTVPDADRKAVRDLAQRLSSQKFDARSIEGMAAGIGVSGQRMTPEQAERAAATIYAERATILQAVRAAGGEGGRKAEQSDSDILDGLTSALVSPVQSQQKFDMLAFLVRRGVLTPAEANAMWGGK